MRPDPSHDPAIEAVEELSNVGAFVILAPAPQEWIKFRNQLLGLQRYPPFGSLPYLIHETTNRLLLGVRIQRTLSGLTTNLARRQMKLLLPALDFVAEELEAVLDTVCFDTASKYLQVIFGVAIVVVLCLMVPAERNLKNKPE
jgi:hypothetical protein